MVPSAVLFGCMSARTMSQSIMAPVLQLFVIVLVCWGSTVRAEPISSFCPAATGNLISASLKDVCRIPPLTFTVADNRKDFVFKFDSEGSVSVEFYVRAVVGTVSINLLSPSGILTLQDDTVEGPATLRLTPSRAKHSQISNSPAGAETWTLSIISAGASAACNVEVSTTSTTLQANNSTKTLLDSWFKECCSGSGFNASEVDPNTPCWDLGVWSNSTEPDTDICQDQNNHCNPNGTIDRLVFSGALYRGAFLPSFNLACSAKPPTTLARFVDLQHLEIVGASLAWKTPDIWAAVGNMTKLQALYLGGNRITGELDAAGCAAMKNVALRALSFRNQPAVDNMQIARPWNSITGIVDACWFSPTLQSLNLALNQIEGIADIPEGITSPLRNLQLTAQSDEDETLTMQSMPKGLSNLKHLGVFIVGGNGLTGAWPALPDSIELVDLSGNNLSGELPSLGTFTNLRLLTARRNQELVGDISQLGLEKLSGLGWLDLTLTSVGGNLNNTDFSSMSRLQLLSLSSAKFVGAIPASLATLPALGLVDFSNNTGITSQGAFGDALTASNRINYYDVSNCAITDLPDGLQNLEFFNSSSRLTQPFNPYWKAFDIHGNQINAVMPAWMAAPFDSDDDNMLSLIPTFFFRYAIQSADGSANEDNRIRCPFRPLTDKQVANSLIMQSNILYPLYVNCWNGTEMVPVASYVSWLAKHGGYPAPPPPTGKFLTGQSSVVGRKVDIPEPSKGLGAGILAGVIVAAVVGVAVLAAVIFLVVKKVVPMMKAKQASKYEDHRPPAPLHPSGAYPDPNQFQMTVQAPDAV